MLFMRIKKQSRSNADTIMVFMLIVVMLPVYRKSTSKYTDNKTKTKVSVPTLTSTHLSIAVLFYPILLMLLLIKKL